MATVGNALYGKARQKFLDGDIDWSVDNIKAVLVDAADYGIAITGATNATPIVITTGSAHGLTTGDVVIIVGVGGNTAANGRFSVTVVDTDEFSLQDADTGANIAGNGTYTSGGFLLKVDTHEFLSDVPSGARVATSGNLSSKSSTKGVADAADITFTAVSGDPCEALVLYKDTGVEGTSPLIACITNATGLPITPNGADINVTWANTANRIFKL